MALYKSVYYYIIIIMTVTRQRRGCDLNPEPTAPESNTLTTRLPSHPGVVVDKSKLFMSTLMGNDIAKMAKIIKIVSFLSYSLRRNGVTLFGPRRSCACCFAYAALSK